MDAKTANRIVEVQEKAMLDNRYRQALSAYKSHEKQIIQLLSSLSQGQQDIIMDYYGSFFELHLYLLEIACQESITFPKR